MKRLLILAALTVATLTSFGCSRCDRRFQLFSWNRGDACNTCGSGGMTYAGPVDGVVYDGVVNNGTVEEVPAPNRASTRN